MKTAESSSEEETPARRAASFWRLFFGVSLPLYAFDQLTKYLILTHAFFKPDDVVYCNDVCYNGRTVIAGFFNLVHVTNTGAAFSMFTNNNAAFIALSTVALLALGALWRYGFFAASAWSRAGFALLLAGVLGNLTDRLAHGAVIDFLQFDLHVPGAHPWPSFNVADSCICLAAGCFVLGSLRELRQPAPAAQ
ncbi:MAG: signal peptidase II [Verrucomicrobia bacterium]|nr:signal peptidase II [Verrucomicrobiota bacterium]